MHKHTHVITINYKQRVIFSACEKAEFHTEVHNSLMDAEVSVAHYCTLDRGKVMACRFRNLAM